MIELKRVEELISSICPEKRMINFGIFLSSRKINVQIVRLT